jgi:Tol biopolymer transport system component
VRKLSLVLLLVLCIQIVPFATGCGLPKASFQADTLSGAAPLNVSFTNTTPKVGADSKIVFDWDFGDGETQKAALVSDVISHKYTKAGTYTVTLAEYSSESPDKTSIITQTITVTHGTLTRLNVKPETVELNIGQVQAFTSEAFDAFDNPILEASLTWKDGDAGTVTTDGSFTAGKVAGVFEKGVISGGELNGSTVEYSPKITILPDPLETASLDTLEIAAGESKQLVAVAKDKYGNTIDNLVATWSIKDMRAGTITEAGLFTASKKAISYDNAIKVVIKQGEKTTEALGKVTVKAGEINQLAIAPSKIDLGKGMTQQFIAVAADSYGNKISSITYTWNAQPTAGSITADGLFTATYNPNDYKEAVTVTAKTGDKEIKKTAEVNIEDDTIIFLSDKSDTTNHVLKYYTMDTRGNNIKNLELSYSGQIQDRLNPSDDGRRLVYTDIVYDDQGYYTNDHTWVSSSDGTWPMVISSGKHIHEPSISPDGTKIAFQSWLTEPPEICVMNIDGSNVVNLTNNALYDDYPEWSPDGQQILYVSKESSSTLAVPKIYIMNADGSNRRQLSSDMGYETMPKWSPDGTKITFASGSFSTGLFSVCVMNADSTNKQTLTEANYDSEYPSWSPDGTKIFFTSNKTDRNFDIYSINVDGSNMVRLTETTGTDFSPVCLMPKKGVEVNASSVVIKQNFGETTMSAQEISNMVKAAVVRIEAVTTEGTGYGTGFVIKSSGIILTANHVISGADKITVFLQDGTKLSATVLARDVIHDLALLKVETSNLPVIEIGSLSGVESGQQVVVLGYPLGNESVSVTSGLVSTIEFDDGINTTWIQTDSAINPGNSGGPLLDMHGKVIGLVTRKIFGVGIEGLGYAVSADTVNMYLTKLLTEAGIR